MFTGISLKIKIQKVLITYDIFRASFMFFAEFDKERDCPLRAQETYFSDTTTMEV